MGEAQSVLTSPLERTRWEGAKARADRQDAYSHASHSSGYQRASSASSRYDRYASHWSDLYNDEEEYYNM